jgi:hypothetical protein
MIDKDKKDLEQRYQLKELIEIVKPEAEKKIQAKVGTPEYFMESGKQQSYSHIYTELRRLQDKFMREDGYFFNWKVANLLLGFCAGVLFAIWIFGGLK